MTATVIDPAQINQATRAADEAVNAALDVVAQLAEAEVTQQSPEPERLRDSADAANDTIQRTYRLLLDMGGRTPDGVPPRRETPLHLLSTPATRRLLDTLRLAVADAELVDAERGNVLPPDFPLQPGESRGTGWAEVLSEIALRLKIEVEGPRGGGRE